MRRGQWVKTILGAREGTSAGVADRRPERAMAAVGGAVGPGLVAWVFTHHWQ